MFGNTKFKGLSVASFLCAAFTLYAGLDKMFSYNSGEWGNPHNAYVGGDAYNYIINGNYATGFFVLTAVFALMGVGFIALWYLSKMSDMQENFIDSYNVNDNCTHVQEEHTVFFPDAREITTDDENQ